jgi:glycosyltransferase involved in cell wall biosynthesis
MSETQLQIVVAAIQHHLDIPSGAAGVAFDAACFLADKGHRVWVVAPAGEGDAPECELNGGVKLLRYRAPAFHPLDPRRARAHQEATKGVLERHVRGSVDIVYGHAPLQYQGACELYGSRAKKYFTVHSPVAAEMEYAWSGESLASRLRRTLGIRRLNMIEKDCLSRSDRITVLSEYTRHALRRVHGPAFESRTVTLPGWVDLDRFIPVIERGQIKTRLGWQTDVPVFFTLRRLVPRMGLDRLLRAARRLVDMGYHFQLVIGGRGPLRTTLERLAGDLHLQGLVRFEGVVSSEDLPLMYAACDAFVLPSTALECFGLIALEALACGRPVLATPVGAIPEVLKRFDPRWLARSPDEEAMAGVMADFLNGRLPGHSAEELRDILRRNYERRLILNRMCDVIFN